MNSFWKRIVACTLGVATGLGSAAAVPPGTSFTYQGRLMQNGQPFTGNAVVDAYIFDVPVGGVPLPALCPPPLSISVNNGLFTVQWDFGAAILPHLQEEALWLEIHINGTVLTPRQQITAAPRALHATSARLANNRFSINGPGGSLDFDDGSISTDSSAPGTLFLDYRQLVLTSNGAAFPGLRFGSTGPGIGFDPALGALGGITLGPGDIYMIQDANERTAFHFGTAAGRPFIGTDRVVPGIWVQNANDFTLGGPDTAQKSIHFGTNGRAISFDPAYGRAGGLKLGNGDIYLFQDANDRSALFFNSAAGSPGIGVDPSAAGIIIIGGRDFTIGGPGETGAKTLHLGTPSSSNPNPPSIATVASNPQVLALNATSSIRLDGSFVGVGLASTAAPQFRLDLPNTAGPAGQGRANAWTTYSSRRWKDNIRPIDGALEKIAALEGVSFDWNAEYGGSHDIGFVAEDVGKVLPELVEWEDDGVFARSLKYDRIAAVAVQGIKEQQAIIDALRQRVDEQAEQLRTLAARIEQLEPAHTR